MVPVPKCLSPLLTSRLGLLMFWVKPDSVAACSPLPAMDCWSSLVGYWGSSGPVQSLCNVFLFPAHSFSFLQNVASWAKRLVTFCWDSPTLCNTYYIYVCTCAYTHPHTHIRILGLFSNWLYYRQSNIFLTGFIATKLEEDDTFYCAHSFIQHLFIENLVFPRHCYRF